MSIDPKRKFLLTGGTGFLGSYLFIELCKKGYPVTLLCRSKDGATAEERVGKILHWFGKNSADFPDLKIIGGSILSDRLGIDEFRYLELLKNPAEIIHCASDTDFTGSNRSAIEEINIGSLRKVLNLAKDASCPHFHYLGTAYSAGDIEGECAEELLYPEKFTNVYEETKNKAEKEVFSFCSENRIRCSIYRPSIVYGEAETGRSRKFNALYYPVKAIAYIKDIMLKDILERGGKRARSLGVSIGDDGRLKMPIRFRSITGGSLNLIPVDFFAKAMTAIIENGGNGGIYHLVNGSPGDIKELTGYTSKYFNIEGLQVTFDNEITGMTGLEELFESYIRMYLPYIADKRKFLTNRAEPILKSRNINCPVMTYEIFRKCIDYAVGTSWGKRF